MRAVAMRENGGLPFLQETLRSQMVSFLVLRGLELHKLECKPSQHRVFRCLKWFQSICIVWYKFSILACDWLQLCHQECVWFVIYLSFIDFKLIFHFLHRYIYVIFSQSNPFSINWNSLLINWAISQLHILGHSQFPISSFFGSYIMHYNWHLRHLLNQTRWGSY